MGEPDALLAKLIAVGMELIEARQRVRDHFACILCRHCGLIRVIDPVTRETKPCVLCGND